MNEDIKFIIQVILGIIIMIILPILAIYNIALWLGPTNTTLVIIALLLISYYRSK